jgi:hypothetical protein
MGSVFKSQPIAHTPEITGAAEKLGGIGQIAQKFGKKESKLGFKSLKQLFPYFRTLLSGDRQAMTELLAPELRQAGTAYEQGKRNIAEFGPRGGGTTSAISGLETARAGAVSDIYQKARPYAAQGLMQTGGLLTSAGAQNLGTATGAYGAQMGGYTNLAELVEKQRQARAQAWGGIGSGIGSILGGII